MTRHVLPAFALVAFLATPAAAADPKPLEFRLTFDKAALDQPFTGRVFVLFLPNEPRGVARGLNWFNPEPGVANDVKDWKPGEPLVLGADAISFPRQLAELKKGKYFVQAVMDRDLGGISFSA